MINKEVKKKIKDLEPYLKSGKLINGNSIIDLYNEYFGRDKLGRKVSYTSCGSCLRRYLKILVQEMKKFPDEEWKDIKGYEGLYQVSNYGDVLSLCKNITLRQTEKQNYLFVYLSKNGIKKQFAVHRLVAEAFIPNPDNYPQVNHKDENPSNNFVENLEWCDVRYNNNYGTRNERIGISNKGKHHSEEWKKNIGKGNSIPILQIDKDTDEIIKEWTSIAEVEMELGYSKASICNCCKGKQGHLTAYGFKWKYKQKQAEASADCDTSSN